MNIYSIITTLGVNNYGKCRTLIGLDITILSKTEGRKVENRIIATEGLSLKLAVALFMDVKRAFDHVSKTRLVEKMIIQWI